MDIFVLKGERLIQGATVLQLWQNHLLGERVVNANRPDIERCLRNVGKQRESCVIEIPADQS